MPEQFAYPYVTRCQDTDDHQNLPNSLINTGGIWGKEVWETVWSELIVNLTDFIPLENGSLVYTSGELYWLC